MKKLAHFVIFALLSAIFIGCYSGIPTPQDDTKPAESELAGTPPIIIEGGLIETDHFTIEINKDWSVQNSNTTEITIDFAANDNRGNLTIVSSSRTQITSRYNLPESADIDALYAAMPRTVESPEDGIRAAFSIELTDVNEHRAISVQSLDPDTGLPLTELGFSYLIMNESHVHNIAGFATDSEILADLHSMLQTFSLH
jgi:hypothetical protein